jgi:glucosamine--fructose-6-phosphate aminotransferase (isomerizing)
VLDLRCGAETAVAATKTYTAQLTVIAAVSAAMLGQDRNLGSIPGLLSETLGGAGQARAAAETMTGFEHAAVLGRGLNLATAFEWALKMQELSYVVAQPFSTADFLHGPIAVVDRQYPVLAVIAGGPTSHDVVEALDRARQAGAPTLGISNTADLDAADVMLRFPEVEEWLSPIPAIVIAQLFTYWLTVGQGDDPDNPRGLSKVTRTL